MWECCGVVIIQLLVWCWNVGFYLLRHSYVLYSLHQIIFFNFISLHSYTEQWGRLVSVTSRSHLNSFCLFLLGKFPCIVKIQYWLWLSILSSGCCCPGPPRPQCPAASLSSAPAPFTTDVPLTDTLAEWWQPHREQKKNRLSRQDNCESLVLNLVQIFSTYSTRIRLN